MRFDHDLTQQIAQFNDMGRAELRVAWVNAFGDAPPTFLSMGFMRKALVWQSQAQLYGGLKAEVKRALMDAGQGKKTVAPPAHGARLVREWNGRRYQVDVAEDGFIMDGRRYKSLSELARRITGTRWSGPRFFGITSKTGRG